MSEKLYIFFYCALYCVDVQSKPETLRKLKIDGLSSRRKKNFLEYSYDSFIDDEALKMREPLTLPQKGALRVYRLASAPLLRPAGQSAGQR